MHTKHMFLQMVFKIVHKQVLFSDVRNLFRIGGYFEKSKFEFFRFYCTLCMVPAE